MRYDKLRQVLRLLQETQTWLHEAPIDKLETVEDALQRNAPIHEVDEAIRLVTSLFPEENP